MKSKWQSDRAPLGCSSSRHTKSEGQPDGGEGGPCSQQTNCYLLLKAPMALHTHGGPNQIVLLPHVSLWGQTGWLAAPASLCSRAFRVGGGSVRQWVLCWFCHLLCMASPQECTLNQCILILASVLATSLLLHFPSDWCMRAQALCWFTPTLQQRRCWLAQVC
jgi:hypothetical protein